MTIIGSGVPYIIRLWCSELKFSVTDKALHRRLGS